MHSDRRTDLRQTFDFSEFLYSTTGYGIVHQNNQWVLFLQIANEEMEDGIYIRRHQTDVCILSETTDFEKVRNIITNIYINTEKFS